MASYVAIFDPRRWVRSDSTDTSVPVKDTQFVICDDGDATKQFQFQASGITAGQTRTLTVEDANYTIAGRNITETTTSVGIGGTPSARLDVVGHVRSTDNTNAPTTGTGVEVVYTAASNAGAVQAFDRDATVFKPLYLSGSTITLTRNGLATTVGMQLDANDNVILRAHGSALATNATDGFTHIPNCAGVPTGVPAHLTTGATPMIYDTADSRVYFYNGGWSTITATAPDIALTLLAPSTDETITAGNSAVAVRKFTVASGKKLTIESGSRMRIL